MPDRKGQLTPEPTPKEKHVGVDGGGTIRAAVFGVNDGLISISCLLLGIAGATQQRSVILISGVAGLLAGSFSMAAGEWISMKSQRELFEREIALEKKELRKNPEYEIEELAKIYHKRGLSMVQARAMSRKLMKNPRHALDAHAREELGLNPDELGSPWGAAFSSLFSFAIGGLIPMLPFFFLAGPAAIVLSATLALLALFTAGALLSKFTGKHWIMSGIRMMLIGALAGLVTHLVGVWLGANVS